MRGYSFLLLATVASTLLLIAAVRDRGRSRSLWVAYVAIGSLGVMAHLYMVLVLGAQFVVGFVVPGLRRQRSQVFTTVAAIIGLVLQINLLLAPKPAGHTARLFHPSMPLSVGRDLLGSSGWAVAVGLVMIALGVGVWWRRIPFAAIIAVVLIEFAVIWVVAPIDLYTRFFVWLAPGVTAMVIAGAVALWRRTDFWRFMGWAGCAVIVATQLHAIPPMASRSAFTNRSAAAVISRAAASGARVCVLTTSWEVLYVYYDAEAVSTAEDIESYDLVASLTTIDEPLIPLVQQAFGNQISLPDATFPGVIYTNSDVGCLEAEHPPDTCWMTTG